MDLAKKNMQMMMEEIYSTCEVGEVFEDRDEMKIFRSDLYEFIEKLDKYERENFNI